MKKEGIIKRARNKEDEIIGDIKSHYIKNTLNGQKKVGISPIHAAGDISLAYYRGADSSREDAYKACVNMLKKDFPEASKFLKDTFLKR